MKHLKIYDDDIKFDWKYFKQYVDTYDPTGHGVDDWNIILEDMLYGLGICIDEEEFQEATGYKKFRQYLRDSIDKQNLNFDKVIYIGRSKKITSKEVFIVKKGKDKSKIKDLSGNELNVTNNQIVFP